MKYNVERWLDNLRLIHEKGILKTNNVIIKNGIFQEDSLSSLLIVKLFLIPP